MVWFLLLSLLTAWILYRWRTWSLAILRVGAILWIGLMILNPGIPRWRITSQKPLLVIDASKSMQWNGKWKQTQKFIKKASSSGFPIRFLLDSTLVQRVQEPEGSFTDLVIPLQKVSGSFVLWSDGNHNAGTNLMWRASQRSAPVFVAFPQVQTIAFAVKIQKFQLSHTVAPSEPLKVQAQWSGTPKSLRLLIDGTLNKAEPVQGQNEWSTTLSPLPSGGHQVTLQLLDTQENLLDQKSERVFVLPSRLRVTLIASHPAPAIAMVRQIFATDALVDVYIQIQSGLWKRLQEKQVQSRAPVIRGDIVVCVDPTPEIWSMIPEQKPVLWIIGRKSAGEKFRGVWVQENPVSQWIPQKINESEFPALQVLWPVRVQDSIVIYWEAESGKPATRNPLPLILRVPGKVLGVITSPEIWKMRLVDPAGFDSLWNEVLDDLMQKQAIFTAFPLKPQVMESEPIQIQAEYRDYRGRRIPGAWVQIHTPQGERLSLLEIADGEFLSPEFYLPKGTHTLSVFYGQGNLLLGKDSVRVSVVQGDVEQWGRGVDSLTLKEIARRSGGYVIRDLSEIKALPPSSTPRPVQRPFRMPWAFFPLLVFLSAEWLLRQRRGWI